jgi:hypothetical protein
MAQLFSNNAVSLLAAPITPASTSLTVLAGHGAMYPQPGPGDYFLITLENQAATVREIIRVIGRSGDSLTFTLGDRGQEGTAALSWSASSGNDTLVDHRVTAETMRQAMLLPTSSGSSWINGATTGPVAILTTANGAISTAVYSSSNRGFKFLVSMADPLTGNAQSFELLGNITGNLSTNSETVDFTRSNRVGFNFPGQLAMTLNTATKLLTVSWVNNYANTVEVHTTKIQHGA